jgi:molybdopterin converting factor small subunit
LVAVALIAFDFEFFLVFFASPRNISSSDESPLPLEKTEVLEELEDILERLEEDILEGLEEDILELEDNILITNV